MSNATSNNQTTIVETPSAVRSLLAQLRSQLRRYSLLSGLLFVLSVAAATFWLTSGIDAGWFALQRLELPIGLRTITLIAMVGGGVWLLIQNLIRPLLRNTRDTELALLLERRFPEFQDRLMTTVEGQVGYPDTGPHVESMLKATMDQAANVASTVATDDVFDFTPLRKRGWLTGLLVLSVMGCGVTQPGSLQQWWNAFVLCEETYHIRTTALNFSVLAQPGDRRLTFHDVDGQPTYLHPQAADLELEMTVPEGLSESGQAWVVPERVRIDVIRDDGTRSRTYVSATSNQTFRFILTRLQESVSVEVLGGDYRTPIPLRIQAVTPPSIDTVEVNCQYPIYTGWNEERSTRVPVLGSEVSLPIGTRFDLSADCNKPLQAARIVTDFFELSGDQQSCRLIAREGYQAKLTHSTPLVSVDGRRIQARLQLVVSEAKDPSGKELAESESVGEVALLSEDDYLPIPSNTSMRFFLHDEDDVISMSPDTLRVRGVADQPPVVAVRTSGVTNSITRRAVIPFVGVIQDDYRLMSAGFQFIVDDETTWRPRNFRNRFETGLTYDVVQSGRKERFDVQPLDLTEGQTLAVTIVAKDGCTIPGPNQTRAEPVVFQIVSNEELLSLLYTRELTLRRRFEEVIQQLEQVRDDLTFHQEVASRIESSAAGESTSAEDRIGLTTCATRCGNSLRRQNNELQSIAAGFDEIVTQLINNAIPPQSLAETMRKGIAEPMKRVTTQMMDDADKSVSRFRVAATSGKPASALVTEAGEDVSEVIVELRRILEKVRDMAEFHEALSDLKSILEEQQRILKETKRQQIKNLGLDF